MRKCFGERIERLEEQILLMEWMLHEPEGAYYLR